MANSTRVDVMLLAFRETCIGLATGLGGALITAAITACLVPRVDLYASILYAIIAGLVSMLGGVGAIGYQYLRKHDREMNFAKQLLQGLAGLVLGFVAFYAVLMLLGSFRPSNGLINTFAVTFPLLGLLIGFNHRIRYD